MLLARLFESLPLTCPNCAADMRNIAFVTEAAPAERVLTQIGEPAQPSAIAPTWEPPVWEGTFEPTPDWDLLVSMAIRIDPLADNKIDPPAGADNRQFASFSFSR